MNSEFDDYMRALDEIDKLNKRLEYEYQRGYSEGYNTGQMVGLEQLAEYMATEVRPIHLNVTESQLKELLK